MIKAVLFDLDGTLIQTEVLKATSYAKAINILTEGAIGEKSVVDAFDDLVGLSRHEVLQGLYSKFTTALERNINSKDGDFIQESLIQKRLGIYLELLNDKSLLSKHFCPYNLKLLDTVHQKGLQVVVATMSHRKEAQRVIKLMEIEHKLNFILTRDDVKEGKPDPEIYNKAKDRLNVEAHECLVIEDSTNGIRAGLAANMHVIAVTNDVTRKSVHQSSLLKPEDIVDDLGLLSDKVEQLIEREKDVS